jgi:parvulin-like peptidyl-prolyl isomerase
MFIAHGEKVRKNARWILGGILILLIPGFIALFTTTTGSSRREQKIPTVAGKPLNPAEFQHAQKLAFTQEIVMGQRRPQGTAEDNARIAQEAVLQILLMRKAKEFGIRVTDADVLNLVRSQPNFLNEAGQFDPDRYRRYLIFLKNNGISEQLYENFVRDQIAIAHLRGVVTASAVAPPLAVRQAYESLHEKIAIDLVKFDAADYTAPIAINNEETRAYYDRNQESFRRPAQTKVRYAYFSKADAAKTITFNDDEIKEFYELNSAKYAGTNAVAPPLDAVKADVQKELLDLRADRAAADRATEFSVKLVPEPGKPAPDFATLAAEAGATLAQTDFFKVRETPAGIETGTAFSQVAFTLTPESPVSDPVTGKDGYYVLEYRDAKPSYIPTLEEAQQEVLQRLEAERRLEATIARAREKAGQLKKAVEAGKDFAAACAELGLKSEAAGPFGISDETPDLPAAERIHQLALGMTTNAVSDLIMTSTGALLFHLKQRIPADPKQFEADVEQFAPRLQERDRQRMWVDWLNSIWREARVDLHLPPRPAPEPPASPELPTEPAPTAGKS